MCGYRVSPHPGPVVRAGPVRHDWLLSWRPAGPSVQSSVLPLTGATSTQLRGPIRATDREAAPYHDPSGIRTARSSDTYLTDTDVGRSFHRLGVRVVHAREPGFLVEAASELRLADAEQPNESPDRLDDVPHLCGRREIGCVRVGELSERCLDLGPFGLDLGDPLTDERGIGAGLEQLTVAVDPSIAPPKGFVRYAALGD